MGKSTAVTQEAGLQPQASDSASSLGIQQVGSNIFGNLNIQTTTPESLKLASESVRESAALVSNTAALSLETVENAAKRGESVFLGGIDSAAKLTEQAIAFASLTASTNAKTASEVLATAGARASGEPTPAVSSNKTLLIGLGILAAVFILTRN